MPEIFIKIKIIAIKHMYSLLVLTCTVFLCYGYKNNLYLLRHVDNAIVNGATFDIGKNIINCTNVGQNSLECNYNGICLLNGNCKCNAGYITFPDSSTTGCNYKQKSKWVAFLLSFFLGPEAGAGEWFLGNENLALGQLLFTWVTLIAIGIFALCTNGASGILAIPWILGVMLWWLCDWILIINGHTNDGNGAPTFDGFN